MTIGIITSLASDFCDGIPDGVFTPGWKAMSEAMMNNIVATAGAVPDDLVKLLDERREQFNELLTDIIDSVLADITIGHSACTDAKEVVVAVLMRCQKVHCNALAHDLVWTDQTATQLNAEFEG